MNIELPPEMESALMAQAQAQNLTLPEYVQLLLRGQAPAKPPIGLSPAERARAWRESVKGLPHTTPLSDEAISRESIYSDRG